MPRKMNSQTSAAAGNSDALPVNRDNLPTSLTLTDKDRALIALLRADARQSTADLARCLGVSRTTVQTRLQRLEETGAIAGYHVRLSPAVEARDIKAMVLIENAPKSVDQIVNALTKMDEIRRVHSVSGNVDLVAEVSAPTMAAMDALLDQIGALEGVVRTNSQVILATRLSR